MTRGVHPTRLILGSGFRWLNGLYLIELERIERGIPEGVLLLAPAVASRTHRESLFATAGDPAHRRWQACAADTIFPDGPDSRAERLSAALDAKDAGHVRRAACMLGWLMLTATEDDEAFRGAVAGLRELRRGFYGNSDASP